MKKTTAGALALTLAALLGTTACGGPDGPPTDARGRTIVRIAVWNYQSTPEFKALIDGFEARYPKIDVQPVDIPADDYDHKLTSMLADGDTTDVLTLKNAIEYGRHATRDRLQPLTDLVRKVDKSAYAGLPDFDVDGEYYAMPYRQDFWVLYYNRDLVGDTDMAHLTWSRFDELAKQFTTGYGSSKVYGAYLPTWRSVVQAVAAAQTGGDLLGGDYSFFKQQYEISLDVQKAGATLPFATAQSRKNDYDALFTGGKAAMVPMGTWWSAHLLKEEAQGRNPVDWGIAPLPQVTKNGRTVTFGSPTAFAVNKKARSSEAAKQFVSWASGPEGAALVARIGIVPSYNDSTTMSAYFDVKGMPDDPLTKHTMLPSKVHLEMPVSDRAVDIDRILTEEHERVMTGNASIEQGIKEMNRRVKTETQ